MVGSVMTGKTTAWLAGGVAALSLGYYAYRRRKNKSAAAAQTPVDLGYEVTSEPPVSVSNLIHFPARAP